MQTSLLEHVLPPQTTQKSELLRMVLALINEHGQAKNWPHDSEIFDGEGHAVMQHLSARGWEKEHIQMYCQEAQMTRRRGVEEVSAGFYNGAQTSMRRMLY